MMMKQRLNIIVQSMRWWYSLNWWWRNEGLSDWEAWSEDQLSYPVWEFVFRLNRHKRCLCSLEICLCLRFGFNWKSNMRLFQWELHLTETNVAPHFLERKCQHLDVHKTLNSYLCCFYEHCNLTDQVSFLMLLIFHDTQQIHWLSVYFAELIITWLHAQTGSLHVLLIHGLVSIASLWALM